MNREQLRNLIVGGIGRLQNSLIWRALSAQEKALLRAGRQFWALDGPVTNAALDAIVAIYLTDPGGRKKKAISHEENDPPGPAA